jgi:hypothetical protein
LLPAAIGEAMEKSTCPLRHTTGHDTRQSGSGTHNFSGLRLLENDAEAQNSTDKLAKKGKNS